MTTVLAWFSSERALRHGSAIYRKPDGSTVNVTRTGGDGAGADSRRPDEQYVGEVIADADGGCVRATWRVRGICD